eukprot:TRINITY_DN24498_c0_g2_i1.p1 TRINITY_DN24498_c0_g2~~TRINITY_DN24498_c0_g2_i1.p1  ORF type:complete len:282 (+),score=64.87 TRINITY_DN24498_c0_g2_i1:79-924(+)
MPSSFFNACCGADEHRTWDEAALQQTDKAAPLGEEEETAVIAPIVAQLSDQAENATLELQANEIKVEEANKQEPKEESRADEPNTEEHDKEEINAEGPMADRVAPFYFSVKIPKDGRSKLGLTLVGTPSPKSQQMVKACKPGSIAEMFNSRQPTDETIQVYDSVLQVNGRKAESVTEVLEIADAAESVELVLSRPKKMEVDVNRNGRKLGLVLDTDHDKDTLAGIVIKRVNETGLASDMPAGTFLPGDLIIAVDGELQRENKELLELLQGERYRMTLLRFC